MVYLFYYFVWAEINKIVLLLLLVYWSHVTYYMINWIVIIFSFKMGIYLFLH